MATNSVQDWLDPLLLHRLLYRENIARVVVGLKILFGLITVASLALVVWLFISQVIGTPPEVYEIEQQVTVALNQQTDLGPSQANSIDFKELSKTKMFGEKKANTKPTSKTEDKPKPKSNVPLELIGTFVSGPESQAIVEDKKKKVQEVFSIGEMIFGEAKLVRIFANKIEINRDGQIEVLVIDESLTGGGEGATKNPSDEEFSVDETELTSALDNLPLLLTQARAVPYFKEGKAIGLRLFAIKSGSLYQKLGLKNGDILKSINDNSLADMSQAMKLFEKLRDERSLRVVLERNRQEKTFFYNVQ